MAKILALIPARAGSKGVTAKNIRPLGGHPLMAWTIAACRKANTVDRIIVSTDSMEYATLAREYGADVPFLRPMEISDDRSTDYEFVLHSLNWLAERGEEPQYIVHMRPTTPLRDPTLIDEAVEYFFSNSRATALRSVHEMSESAYKTFEIAPAGQLKPVGSNSTALDAANHARQEFPRTYMANGYVDVLSTAFIRQSELLHGDYVLPFITPPVIEVDTEEDFEHLEYQLSRTPEMIRKAFG